MPLAVGKAATLWLTKISRKTETSAKSILHASGGIDKSDCGNATSRLFHHNLLAFVDIYALCQAVIVFHCGILLGYGAV